MTSGSLRLDTRSLFHGEMVWLSIFLASATHGPRDVVQLIGGRDIDFRTGVVVYDDITFSRPFDGTTAGDPRWFDAMLTSAGLAEIKTYADGIGPWKPQVVPLRVEPWRDKNVDGSVCKGSTSQAKTQAPTSLVADAHMAGLFIRVFTFRNEGRYLAADYGADAQVEDITFFRLGVDGIFTDFSNTGFMARAAFLRGLTSNRHP